MNSGPGGVRGGEGYFQNGLYGTFFKCTVYLGRENRHYRKGHKIRCKVKEMAAKDKCLERCQILADITTRNTLKFEPLSN